MSKHKATEQWLFKKLCDIALVNPKLANKDQIDPDFEIQFLPMKLVEEVVNKIHLSETRRFSEVQKGSYTPFIDGDVIFAKVTPCMENGKIAIVENLKNGLGFGSSEFHVIRSGNDLNNKYLFFFLVQARFREQAKNAMTGAVGLRRVPKQFLENFQLPLPSLSIQQAIVSKIEELFSELDEGIGNLKLVQQQLKTYRQAVLKWAFEGKLTNGRGNGSYDVSVEDEIMMAAEPEVKYHAATKLNGKNHQASQSSENGELPEGWKWVKLGEVCSNVEYGSATKSSKEGKVPVLRMGNIQNGRFDWSDLVYTSDNAEVAKYLLTKNDVLFNRTNSAELVGKTAIYKGERPAIFAGYLIRINRIESQVDGDYLTYYLNTHEARQYGNTVRSFGVNQSNINGTKLKTYPIPLAPLSEQKRVVCEIESRLSVADKMEESIQEALQQAEALRQSILKKAFEGRLVE